MTQEEFDNLSETEAGIGGCMLWFAGGLMLSVVTICALGLLSMLLVSTAVTAYLGWEVSGAEVVINVPNAGEDIVLPANAPAIPGPSVVSPPDAPQLISNNEPLPEATPIPGVGAEPASASSVSEVVALAPTNAQVHEQLATLSAIATQSAAKAPQPVEAEVPVADAPVEESTTDVVQPATEIQAEQPTTDVGEVTTASGETAGEFTTSETASTSSVAAPTTSNNQYEIIPLEQPRDGRVPAEHGDLNVHLRGAQRTDSSEGRQLISLAGDTDPAAPNFRGVLEPDFVAEYTLKNWDWGCNCASDWINSIAMMGVKVTPGQDIFIPRVPFEIYQGRFRATVLYASEDSVTISYTRDGSVANGYSVHYVGLNTDPNLVAQFNTIGIEEMQAPGLDFETPVGTAASSELKVVIRDRGKFMDLRSEKDWW